MADVFLFIRGVAFGLLLLLCLRLWFGFRKLQTGRLMLALFVGLGAYIVAPFLNPWPWLMYPAVVLATSVPATFWLFAQALFDDWDRRGITVGRAHVIAVLLFLGICFAGYWSRLAIEGGTPNSTMSWALFYLSYTLRIAFIIMALSAILAQWREDLVEARRRLRIIIVTGAAGYILAVACVELLMAGKAAPLLAEVGNSLLIALLLVAANVWLMLAGPDSLAATLGIPYDLEEADPEPQVPGRGPADDRDQVGEKNLSVTEQKWLQALHQYMETELGYHSSDLTIRGLGERLTIPEHLLRNLINQHLGYRNFNDYLNHYRITEAAARLADPEQERLPILTIALEVGYASLTPFNRAFKAQFQQTPSEYRRQQPSQ